MKEFIKKNIVLVIILLTAVVFIVSYAAYSYHGLMSYRAKVSAIIIENIDISGIPDGIYTGECDVGYISAKVTVTIKDGVITNIDLDHQHDRGAAAERVVTDILARQRVDVDAVSGATNSSSVIMKAISNALGTP